MDGPTEVERREGQDAAETEGARRATGVSAGAGGGPDPEVPEKAKRRRFTAEYKLRILREADACKGSGEIGALLRREGLYSSHLVDCGVGSGRRERWPGCGRASGGRRRRRWIPRVKQLERENARLQRRLKQAETIIEVQKKVAEILGIPLNAPEPKRTTDGGHDEVAPEVGAAPVCRRAGRGAGHGLPLAPAADAEADAGAAEPGAGPEPEPSARPCSTRCTPSAS